MSFNPFFFPFLKHVVERSLWLFKLGKAEFENATKSQRSDMYRGEFGSKTNSQRTHIDSQYIYIYIIATMHGIILKIFFIFYALVLPPEPLLISFASQKVIFFPHFSPRKSLNYFTRVRHFPELLVFLRNPFWKPTWWDDRWIWGLVGIKDLPHQCISDFKRGSGSHAYSHFRDCHLHERLKYIYTYICRWISWAWVEFYNKSFVSWSSNLLEKWILTKERKNGLFYFLWVGKSGLDLENVWLKQKYD